MSTVLMLSAFLIFKVCEGKGVIRATGQKKYNSVDINRIVGSRWTSVEICHGHRQFECSQIQGSNKKNSSNPLEFRMSNCCGPNEKRVHIWITLEELRNKSIWRQGWTTLEDIKSANRGALHDAKICFLCKGNKILKCDECDGTGQVGTQQVLHD